MRKFEKFQQTKRMFGQETRSKTFMHPKNMVILVKDLLPIFAARNTPMYGTKSESRRKHKSNRTLGVNRKVLESDRRPPYFLFS